MSDIKEEKGELSIHTENLLPIIKKWLYSDREIFIRELVSNGVDAMTKLRLLNLSSEVKETGELFVDVCIDKEKKTLTFRDTGIGMTGDEIKKYINQIAFSGAADFISQHEKNNDLGEIIGHFGLGFYSAFMVSDKVEIFSLSYQDGAQAVHWTNDGGTEFSMEKCDKKERGTDIVLHINKENEDFLEEYKVREVIEKYCNFLPYPIKLNGKEINDQHPLWLKHPSEVKDEDYKNFYSKLFPMESEPLFWIHLDVEVPFNLKGILYFPKIRHELDSSKGRIKLFCNQVFVTDNAKEIIPEFLTLLQGCIDIPDLPLNVSRSYLQNDPYVKKISEHITKKVADKLNEIYKKDRSAYEGFWDDISIFVKYGMMNNEKFFDKVKNVLMFKTSDNVYKTLDEYKEKNKGINKEENGKQVILYASDPEKQAALIDMCKGQGLEVIYFNSMIDVHFIQFLEMKDSSISFIRIDSDTNAMLSDDKKEKIVDENNKSSDDKIEELFNSVLKPEENKSLKIKVQALKDTKIPSIIVFSEHMRRFKEMNAMFRGEMGGADIFSDHTLIINSSNELIAKLAAAKDDESKKELVEKLVLNVYDSALLAQDNLKGEKLVKFLERTTELTGMNL